MTKTEKQKHLVDLVVIAIKSDTKKEFIRKRDLYLSGRTAAEQADIMACVQEAPSDLIKYLEDNLWVDVLFKQRSKMEIYETADKLFAEYEAKQGG
jgi:hypothetical protein